MSLIHDFQHGLRTEEIRMLDSDTKQRFEKALAAGKLKELAHAMQAEGLRQVEIYDLFESFWQYLGNEKREADEDALYDALECIVGYCARGSHWFGNYLSNEEINAYRCGLTVNDVQEIGALVSRLRPDLFFCGVEKVSGTGELLARTFQVNGMKNTRGTSFAARKGPGGWELVAQEQDNPL